MHPARRADNGIMCHRVVAGIVQIVGPLVDLLRAGLDGLHIVYIRHAVRGKHAHHFRHGNGPQILRHHKVHKIVHKGKLRARDLRDSHGTIELLLPEHRARGCDLFGIALKTAHHIGTGPANVRKKTRVVPSDDYDQSPLNARLLKDCSGRIRCFFGSFRDHFAGIYRKDEDDRESHACNETPTGKILSHDSPPFFKDL